MLILTWSCEQLAEFCPVWFLLGQIIGSVVEPLLQMTSVSASRLNPIDMATYMINSIHLIQSTLALFEFTDQRLEMLQAQVRLVPLIEG